MFCKICQSQTIDYAKSFIMPQKFAAKYLKCSSCDYVFIENPHWLELAYEKPITDSDVGLVDRNIRLSIVTASLIKFFFDANGKFLDYAGGYGLFVRLIRNLGFNFYWKDKYSQNLFANMLEHDNSQNYDLLTSFEVLEHLEYPLQEIEEMLKFSSNLFVSTEFLPVNNPLPEEWDYFAIEHGQHIGIFSLKTLKFIAHKYELNLYSNGINLHLFTKKKISKWLFLFSIKYRFIFLLQFFLKKNSLEHQDRKNSIAKQKKAIAS